MPPDASSASPRPHRTLRIVLWTSIAAAVLVIALNFLLAPRGGFVHVQKFPAYKGTLTVYTSTYWKAASGEKVVGLIEYDPLSGSVSYLISPSTPTASVVTPSTYHDHHALIVQSSTTTLNLVSLNLLTQASKTVASIPTGEGSFGQSVWSPDGSRIAYVMFAKTGMPKLFVTGAGTGTSSIPFGVPLAFSPNGTQVMLDTRPFLSAVDVATGKKMDLTRVAFAPSGVKDQALYASPSGNFIITTQPTDSLARVYHVDWTLHTISAAGVIPLEKGSSLVLNPADQVLVTAKGGFSKAYKLSATAAPALVAVYNFHLPDSVNIISWNTP